MVADEGADFVEVGVPFSDPLADGPVIQRASHHALQQGMTTAGVLELVAEAALPVPVILFSYLNPILRYGVDRFLRDARAVGADGLLLTDLPGGADPGLEETLRRGPLDLIRLVAPTTSPGRLVGLLASADGFVYLIARLGVTGARTPVTADLARSVAAIRAHSSLPIAVGFGIDSGEQARAVAGLADGVVVGTALVRRLADGVPAARALVRELRRALDTAAVA